jgi:hypothetical protein
MDSVSQRLNNNVVKIRWFDYKIYGYIVSNILKLAVCILLRQAQGFRLTQHWFEYFIQ